MNGFTRSLLALVLISGAASATKIPIPIEGATLNVSFQLQPQFSVVENGTPQGTASSGDLGYEFNIRRTRLLINGDASPNFAYLIQLDNPNFGKRGDYTGRVLVQDAWVGWAPLGQTAGTVIYLDAGILLQPISRHLLVSTTNFATANVHADSFRGLGGTENVGGNRDLGVQIRGWALDKKVGFRGGFYQGQRGFAAADAGKNIHDVPRMAGLVNIDLIGSEEGNWLYADQYWAKDPIVSVGAAALYQRDAIKGPVGITDQFLGSAWVFVDFPLSEESEGTLQLTGYRSNTGQASSNTGFGGFVDVGWRFGKIKPYFSFEFFSADSCPTGLEALCIGKTGAVSLTNGIADSRLVKFGVNYFVDRNRNHLNAEFAINRGQASGDAVPAAQSTNIGMQGTKSFLLHWNHIF